MPAHDSTPSISTAEVVILGSGFAGSILALILQKQGRDVVVIDRATHPRFAIGESSTPTANMVLASLARQYDLPRLLPLASYGSWRTRYPQLTCGRKRGFSYFKHEPHTPFQPRDDHANELLVAANSNDHVSDTQWLRADIDAFLASEVQAAGIRFWEATQIQQIKPRREGGWHLDGHRAAGPCEVATAFIVDATGAAGVMPRALGLASQGPTCRTNSRAVFGHFRNVAAWQELAAEKGCRTDEHPFPCDLAAQHQILDEGWMWLLRFDSGVTSAGLVLQADQSPLDPTVPPQREWQRCLDRYPSLGQMFAQAEIVDPPGTLVRSQRLQRRWQQVVGSDWAALPNTAGFIDPLHSTGIAHSLCGVERLAGILEDHWQRPSKVAAPLAYQESVLGELDLIDQLVSACYHGLSRFPLLVAASMLYFAAATTYEERRAAVGRNLDFLNAHDPELRSVVEDITERFGRVRSDREATRLADDVAAAIRPFNTVGLCNPASRNMYRYTVAPEA